MIRCSAGAKEKKKPRALAHTCRTVLGQRRRTMGQRDLKRIAQNKPPSPHKDWPSNERESFGISMRVGSPELFRNVAEQLVLAPAHEIMNDDDFNLFQASDSR